MICETSWCDCMFQAESVEDYKILKELHQAIIKQKEGQNYIGNYIGIEMNEKLQLLLIQTYY